MKGYRLMTLVVLMVAGSASALADDDLDVTMRMVTDQEPHSDTVVRQIELPRAASDRAHEMAAPGLERADEASERGREAAGSARERGQEARARMGERTELPDLREPISGTGHGGRDAGGSQHGVPSRD